MEKYKLLHSVWKRMKNKDDVDDILMNTKVDGIRIF